ncbi:MAG TPA: fumarylacetoacetate hydrolase family protein, partial [Burkholderiales bacterium]|nr:fumarylacetoacetate hydrolase family protein [Burkholderiales bacterium]
RLRLADYVRLIVEFEIAVEMAADLPVADAPFTRERVAQAVASVAAALEIADDRGADYATLPQHPFELIADNTWNEGVVLGEAVKDWAGIDLAAVRGVARVNGRPIGEGRGADAMGHPLASVAWVADHLAAHGRGLLRGDFVITGSLVTSFAPQRGDRIRFSAQRLGEVELEIE